MADCNRAAIHVEALIRNSQPVRAIKYLDGESLVELPEVDIRNALAGTLQEFRNGEDRANTHLVGLASGDCESTEDSQRLQA